MSDEAEKTQAVSASSPPVPAEPSRAVQAFDGFELLLEEIFRPGALRGLLDWNRPLMSEIFAGLESRVPRVDVIDREADALVRGEVPDVDKKGPAENAGCKTIDAQ